MDQFTLLTLLFLDQSFGHMNYKEKVWKVHQVSIRCIWTRQMLPQQWCFSVCHLSACFLLCQTMFSASQSSEEWFWHPNCVRLKNWPQKVHNESWLPCLLLLLHIPSKLLLFKVRQKNQVIVNEYAPEQKEINKI